VNLGELSTTRKVAIVLIAIGALLAALGLLLGGVFVPAALAAFGGAAIVGGLHSVVTREHRTGRSGSSSLPRVHTGFSAIIFGLAFIVVGAALVVAGVAAIVGGGEELWSQLAEQPGIVAIGLGLGIVLLGVATSVSRWTFESESTVWWQRLPGSLLGLLVVAIGVVVFATGWSLAHDPPPPDGLLEHIASTLTRWLGVD
jgi:Ca2+/Na+ antiporter